MHPSDVETLLISGSIDVAAPAERATEELLPSLAIGQQVILAEMSHNDLPGLDTQPQATERLVTSFYGTGIADDSLYTYAPIDFRMSWGYPALAKLGFSKLQVADQAQAIIRAREAGLEYYDR